MIKGTWFDSFAYEGEDPETEVDCEVCNGQVFTNEELSEALPKLKMLASIETSEPTKQLLYTLIEKAEFGMEIWE